MAGIQKKAYENAPLIVIADSADSVGSEIAERLENLGWEVVQASSLQSAIDVCAARRIDVIFADFAISEANIGDTIQSFRYDNAKSQITTIIAYSNKDQPPLMCKSLDPYIDLYVKSPINYKLLTGYIAKASTRRLEKIHSCRNISGVND